MIATLVMVALIPVSGMLADRFGSVNMIRIGCFLILLCAIPAFRLLNSNSVAVVFAALMLLVLAQLFFDSHRFVGSLESCQMDFVPQETVGVLIKFG